MLVGGEAELAVAAFVEFVDASDFDRESFLFTEVVGVRERFARRKEDAQEPRVTPPEGGEYGSLLVEEDVEDEPDRAHPVHLKEPLVSEIREQVHVIYALVVFECLLDHVVRRRFRRRPPEREEPVVFVGDHPFDFEFEVRDGVERIGEGELPCRDLYFSDGAHPCTRKDDGKRYSRCGRRVDYRCRS